MSRPPPISTLFPYTTLFRSRIESFANAIRGELVFRFAGFLVEDQQQIAGQHAVEIFKSNLADLTLRVRTPDDAFSIRSEEHTSELQSQSNLVCRLLLEKKKA